MKRFFVSLLVVVNIVLPACSPVYHSSSVQYSYYEVQQDGQKNQIVNEMLKPYADSMNIQMNEVVGYAEINLDKKQPESTLGNFMADAFLTMARKRFAMPVDAALMNYGGIRLNQIPAGEVTRSKIFELMPFDNILILQKIRGDVLQQFLDLTAERGGWPCAGIKMELAGKKAIHVMIDGKPLNPTQEYIIANSDYIANGGDNADMLRTIPQISVGYLFRDAIFDYIKELKKQGKGISAKIEKRVTYAE